MSHMDREKVKLLQRLRKVRGQLDAVERSLNADEDCGGQLMLLAAVRGGVNALMGEVLETHIRFHLVDGAKEQIAPELAEDLIDLVHADLKLAHADRGSYAAFAVSARQLPLLARRGNSCPSYLPIALRIVKVRLISGWASTPLHRRPNPLNLAFLYLVAGIAAMFTRHIPRFFNLRIISPG